MPHAGLLPARAVQYACRCRPSPPTYGEDRIVRSPNGLFRKRRMLTPAAIITALGRGDARKQVERELGCTRSQAWEMAYRAKVPGKLRQAFIALLDRSIERNLGTHEEMLARAARRRADDMDSPQAALPGLGERAGDTGPVKRATE